MGLPPTMANGTNRVGILLQNIGAVWSFRRHGLVERRWVFAAALPAAGGAILGTFVALWIEGETFKRILAFLMVGVTLWTLWDPLKTGGGGDSGAGRGAGGAVLGIGFFIAGIYGGFVQAGVGFLLLAVTTLAGHNLVRGNALKVLCVLAFTPISLALFAWHGQVAWLPGLILAAGTILGGLMGVRLTVLKGHAWVRGVVTVTVIALALRLWFSS
jgi:uncharacterized membrane protein YfcA